MHEHVSCDCTLHRGCAVLPIALVTCRIRATPTVTSASSCRQIVALGGVQHGTCHDPVCISPCVYRIHYDVHMSLKSEICQNIRLTSLDRT